MKKIISGIQQIGIGTPDEKRAFEWYKEHLGVPIDDSFGGFAFDWKDQQHRPDNGYTIWSPFKQDTEYIEPSKKDFMFNFIVDDLEALLEVLDQEGVEQSGEMEDTEFGKFAWVLDPEGNKVELWEPAEN